MNAPSKEDSQKILANLLAQLDKIETEVMSSLSAKYKPEDIFKMSKEEIKQQAESILRGFTNAKNSVFQNKTTGEWEVPTVSLGEVLLAGGRYTETGKENRDQVAHDLVNNYINANKGSEAASYKSVKDCLAKLATIETLKGFTASLSKLLNSEMPPENLKMGVEGLSTGLTATLQDAVKQLNSSEVSQIKAYVEVLNKEVIKPLQVKAPGIQKITMPEAPAAAASKERRFSMFTPLEKYFKKQPAAPIDGLIKDLRQLKNETIDNVLPNTSVSGSLDTLIKNLENMKGDVSILGPLIEQHLGSLASIIEKEKGAAKQTALIALEGTLRDFLDTNPNLKLEAETSGVRSKPAMKK